MVYGICSGCHSIRLVTQHGMSRQRWEELLDWMVGKQGMAELHPEPRETVLDYPAEHYGRRRREDGLSPFNQPQPLMPARQARHRIQPGAARPPRLMDRLHHGLAAVRLCGYLCRPVTRSLSNTASTSRS